LTAQHQERQNKYELALQLKEDIAEFPQNLAVSRLVTCWCGSTNRSSSRKKCTPRGKVCRSHEVQSSGDRALNAYAWARSPAESPTPMSAESEVDIRRCKRWRTTQRAHLRKDFKTGQTLMKTILAPGFKAAHAGVDGWFSTNILESDGEVLEDPGSSRPRKESKLSVLEYILQPKLYAQL